MGGTLEDRPRYDKTRCFETFPFPALELGPWEAQPRAPGEQLDAHRKGQQARHPHLTLTGIDNVLEKLRSGKALYAREKQIHDDGLVTLLRQIHDEIGVAVLCAYGWDDLRRADIPVRLDAASEAQDRGTGIVAKRRWQAEGCPESEQSSAMTWPDKLPEQVAPIRALLLDLVPDPAALSARFSRANRKREDRIASILETLRGLGL